MSPNSREKRRRRREEKRRHRQAGPSHRQKAVESKQPPSTVIKPIEAPRKPDNAPAAILSADLECRLLAQEHRTYHVLKNFFIERSKWPRNDPRRDAVCSALLWRLISPGTVAASSASIAAVITVFALLWQNHLFREQNQLFREQNKSLVKALDLQTKQVQLQIDELALERERVGIERATDQSVKVAEFSRILFDRSASTGLPRVNANTRSAAARAYASIRNEQGEHLTLAEALLSDCLLSGIEFSNADLRRADLKSANLFGAKLELANLRGANLSGANLSFAGLTGADVSDTILTNANLTSAVVDDVTIGLADSFLILVPTYSKAAGKFVNKQQHAKNVSVWVKRNSLIVDKAFEARWRLEVVGDKMTIKKQTEK